VPIVCRVYNERQRSAAMRRAGLLLGIVLLKTFISRIRNLSTEDEFPAWRIADVGSSLLSSIILFCSYFLFFRGCFFSRIMSLILIFY